MTDTTIRSLLHSRAHIHQVVFNPTTPQEWPGGEKKIVDLTMDVVGDQTIQVDSPKEMIAWLNTANVITVDSQYLAAGLGRMGVRVPKLVSPFGHNVLGQLTQVNFTNVGVGVLNNSFQTHVQLKAFEYVLTGLGLEEHPVRVFGSFDGAYDPVVSDGGVLAVEESFEQFAGKIQILLLPAHVGALVPLTLPLSLMLSGAVIICSRQSAYYELQGNGVFKVNNDRNSWQDALISLGSRPQLLSNLMQANHKAVSDLSRNSVDRLRSYLKK